MNNKLNAEIEQLWQEKKKLSMERDLCAEFYNVMLSYANNNINDLQKYKYYLDVVELMEPYAKQTKEEIKKINKKICNLLNVNDIKDTPYNLDCEDRYGFSKPDKK